MHSADAVEYESARAHTTKEKDNNNNLVLI